MTPFAAGSADRLEFVGASAVEVFALASNGDQAVHTRDPGDRVGAREWLDRDALDAVEIHPDGPRFHDTVFAFESGQLFGLHQHAVGIAGAFEERRAGLAHVGFAVGDRAELESWVIRLDALGVKHGGIVDAYYGSGLSFCDPDNIALEFFAPPA